MRREIAALALGIGAGVILLGCGGGGEPSKELAQHLLTGSITVREGARAGLGGECIIGSESRYSDIKAGTQVRIKDENDLIIAIGELDKGHIANISRSPDTVLSEFDCEFPFSIPYIPELRSYSVEVSHRKGPTFSLDDMKENKWSVDLTLGD